MARSENSFNNLPAGEVGDIARKLIFAVSTAVAEAAGSARESLRSERPKQNERSLEQQILEALKQGPASVVTLRKRISEESAGQRPAQAEFGLAIEALLADELIAKSKSGERELFSLTDEGQVQVNSASKTENSGNCKCDGMQESASTLKAAQRLSSVVLDVSANGSPSQKRQAAEELEQTRKRLLQILADDQLG